MFFNRVNRKCEVVFFKRFFHLRKEIEAMSGMSKKGREGRPMGSLVAFACVVVVGLSAMAPASDREHVFVLREHLGQAGLGSISEIFDGDPPHYPRGCIAQVWSVGELLCCWIEFELFEE